MLKTNYCLARLTRLQGNPDEDLGWPCPEIISTVLANLFIRRGILAR